MFCSFVNFTVFQSDLKYLSRYKELGNSDATRVDLVTFFAALLSTWSLVIVWPMSVAMGMRVPPVTASSSEMRVGGAYTQGGNQLGCILNQPHHISVLVGIVVYPVQSDASSLQLTE